MTSTKQKILNASLLLFNRDGLVNVRLQHIADEAFVSVGNLAYHYANKEMIVLALYEALAQRQEDLLTEYRIVPLFDNIDRLIRHSFHLQKDYIFFYLDALEIARAYPAVAAAHRQHIHPQHHQLRAMLDFNVARGALVAEPLPGTFDQLTDQLWMTMDFWRYQRAVRAEENEDENAYRLAIWTLLIPYFTAMGKLEYQQMLEHPYDFYF